jgi:hypothetical protein
MTTTAPEQTTAAPFDLRDAVDVLSVYADADPALGAAWQAPVRAGLRAAVRDARDRPRAVRLALDARLDEIAPALESVLDPRSSHRGRALFVGIDSGEILRVDVRAPLPSLVQLADHAVTLPLLAALQDTRAAGVVTVSWARLELSEWKNGELSPLETIELAPPDDPERGRPGTNPAVPQPFPERDRYQTGVGARVGARLREAGDELARTSAARGWDVVVADGDPRLLEMLEHRAGGLLVRRQGTVADAVAAHRAAERARLVTRLDESAAATRDPAVVGHALAEGRVEHLLLPRADLTGDGMEAMVRRAVETGADIAIADLDAPAALLRW